MIEVAGLGIAMGNGVDKIMSYLYHRDEDVSSRLYGCEYLVKHILYLY